MTELTQERRQGGNRAILVHTVFPDSQDLAYDANEFSLLTKSAGAEVLHFFTVRRKFPQPKYLIGHGKVADIKQKATELEADLIIFNHELSPAQERNLEKELECRVLDRTGLILDIFAQRARSHEGKLQVELAQLEHLSSRLVRGWTHLERQKGGIGLRGPGETQLESDRRMVATRIKQINKKLAKVSATRELGRKMRKKARLPTVSLVGYTNAGKSTLFNQLVASNIYAADKLFATLDATLRKLVVSPHVELILADTVGFVSNLPHKLISAFKSTLEETLNADLLLHVIDAANENFVEQKLDVEDVLVEIGADKIPILEIMNKIDVLADVKPHVDYAANGQPRRVWLSAQDGAGVSDLLQCLDHIFQNRVLHFCVKLSPAEGDIRSLLFKKGTILSESYDDYGFCKLELELESIILDNLHFEEN